MKRGGFARCKGAWCYPCYRELRPDWFAVRTVRDEEGEEIVGAQRDDDFMVARKGDNWTTPFQCDRCHFVNMNGREAGMGSRDQVVLALIRRANLDAFWDRSTSTVEAHGREVARMDRIADELGMTPFQTSLGPWPLEDAFGMKVAVLMLKRSLDPGRNESRVQFDTVQKMRACATNLYQAGVGGLMDNVASFERNRLWLTKMPTHSYWFHRFVGGLHKRVGESKKQDEPILIATLVDLQESWEEEWESAGEDEQQNVTTVAAWFLLGFCCGLRGEEMLFIETAGTRRTVVDDWSESQDSFEVIITGKTKGNQVRGRRFGIPCAWETEGSGLKPGLWTRRLIRSKERSGVLWQYLFQNQNSTLKVGSYKDMFLGALALGQARGFQGIKEQANVYDEYGILRSLRRGVTAHARNVGVPGEIINSVNRWRKHANSQTGAPRLDMVGVYSQLEAIKPYILRFSKSL